MAKTMLTVALLLLTSPAFGATGYEVRSRCDAASGYSSSVCLRYVSGVADGLTARGDIFLPEGPARGRLGAVFQKYLIDHPVNLDRQAYYLAEGALMEAFPCPDSEGQQ